MMRHQRHRWHAALLKCAAALLTTFHTYMHDRSFARGLYMGRSRAVMMGRLRAVLYEGAIRAVINLYMCTYISIYFTLCTFIYREAKLAASNVLHTYAMAL